MKEIGFIIGLIGFVVVGVIAVKGLFLYLFPAPTVAATPPPPVVAAAATTGAVSKKEKAKSWVTVVTYGLLVLSLTGWVVAKIRDSEMDRPRREEIFQAQFALLETQKAELARQRPTTPPPYGLAKVEFITNITLRAGVIAGPITPLSYQKISIGPSWLASQYVVYTNGVEMPAGNHTSQIQDLRYTFASRNGAEFSIWVALGLPP